MTCLAQRVYGNIFEEGLKIIDAGALGENMHNPYVEIIKS